MLKNRIGERNRSDNRFVAGFIGSPAMNFLDATVTEQGTIDVPALKENYLLRFRKPPQEG